MIPVHNCHTQFMALKIKHITECSLSDFSESFVLFLMNSPPTEENTTRNPIPQLDSTVPADAALFEEARRLVDRTTREGKRGRPHRWGTKVAT